MVSQELSGATAPVAGGRGGINAAQVGLGMQLASIDTIHTQGSHELMERTVEFKKYEKMKNIKRSQFVEEHFKYVRLTLREKQSQHRF